MRRPTDGPARRAQVFPLRRGVLGDHALRHVDSVRRDRREYVARGDCAQLLRGSVRASARLAQPRPARAGSVSCSCWWGLASSSRWCRSSSGRRMSTRARRLPITAFLSVVSKAAGLAVLVRFLMVVALPDSARDAELVLDSGRDVRAEHALGQPGGASRSATSSECWPIRASRRSAI